MQRTGSQERWLRCKAMDRQEWACFLAIATEIDLANLLRRYEWLVEFVMATPDCARLDEKRELWRRIEVLRERLGISEAQQAPVGDISTEMHVEVV